MFNQRIKNNKGFTLVETMVAVFILSLVIISLMTVVARSLFASRYARDEIISNYLLQEAVDYIRNDRDTIIFLDNNEDSKKTWQDFIDKYKNCIDEDRGCYIDVFTSLEDPNSSNNIKQCDYNNEGAVTTCPNFFFDASSDNYFYNYEKKGSESNYKRKILFTVNPENPDEVIVKVTVYWINGDVTKSKSLQTSLTRWQL